MSLEEAKRHKQNYPRRLKRLRIKATCGDDAAARKLMSLLAEYHNKLKDLGYRTTDEREDGRINRLVPITEEWKQSQRDKRDEADRLMAKARKTMDPEDMRAALRAL